MNRSLHFSASAVLALIMEATCFGQRYMQINLVSNTQESFLYRSSTDKPLGYIPRLRQQVVGL